MAEPGRAAPETPDLGTVVDDAPPLPQPNQVAQAAAVSQDILVAPEEAHALFGDPAEPTSDAEAAVAAPLEEFVETRETEAQDTPQTIEGDAGEGDTGEVPPPPEDCEPEPSNGWHVGEPIDALTKAGNIPAWSTVRARYWKNVASDPNTDETPGNLARMKCGLAPQHAEIGASKELNHIVARYLGGGSQISNLEEVWPWEHAAVDPFRFYSGPTP